MGLDWTVPENYRLFLRDVCAYFFPKLLFRDTQFGPRREVCKRGLLLTPVGGETIEKNLTGLLVPPHMLLFNIKNNPLCEMCCSLRWATGTR